MRPRERYTLHGPNLLGDIDLMALAIGVGQRGRSPQQIATTLLSAHGGLHPLLALPVRALVQSPGIGPALAVRIHASLHAGCRAGHPTTAPSPVVSTPEDAVAMLKPGLVGLDVEELHALYLDRRNQVLDQRSLTRGNDACTIVDPRQVFRPAVACGAAAVVVAHNHPSGDPTPSPEDLAVTRRLAEAGNTLGVQLLDHIVIGARGWTSLAQDHQLPIWGGSQALVRCSPGC